jgi:hypothetical protein
MSAGAGAANGEWAARHADGLQVDQDMNMRNQ